MHCPQGIYTDKYSSFWGGNFFLNFISLPVKPEAHVHEKSFTRSVHVPPFLHGSGEQSLMFVSHVLPKVIRKHFIVYTLKISTLKIPRFHIPNYLQTPLKISNSKKIQILVTYLRVYNTLLHFHSTKNALLHFSSNYLFFKNKINDNYKCTHRANLWSSGVLQSPCDIFKIQFFPYLGILGSHNPKSDFLEKG